MATLPPVMTYEQLVNDAGLTEAEAQAYLEDEAADAASGLTEPSAAEAVNDPDALTDGAEGDALDAAADDDEDDSGDAVKIEDARDDDKDGEAGDDRVELREWTPDDDAPATQEAESEAPAAEEATGADEPPTDFEALLSTRYTPGVDPEAVAKAREYDAGKMISALSDRYDEGEITREELDKGLLEVAKQGTEVDRILAAAEDAPSNETMQAQLEAWQKLTTAYQTANPSLNEPEAFAAFDAVLRRYMGTDSPIRKLPMPRIIERAHREVSDIFAAHGRDLPDPVTFKEIVRTQRSAAKEAAAKPTETAEQKAITDPKHLPKPDPKGRPAPPVTLRNVSNDGGGVDSDDPRFAAIDKMSESDALAAFNRLPADAQEAYLRRA